jgi:hypothetical protein
MWNGSARSVAASVGVSALLTDLGPAAEGAVGLTSELHAATPSINANKKSRLRDVPIIVVAPFESATGGRRSLGATICRTES